MTKKEEIISVARVLFTQYGYKKVSMDEIASEANVTKKTIYSYFKDKDTLFMYFINEELIKMKEIIEKEEKEGIPFIEIVSTNIYKMLNYQKDSLLISNISKEAKGNNKEQYNKFLDIYEKEIVSYIEEKIESEIKKGNIKECDIHLTSFIIYKICLTLMFEYDKEIDSKKATKEITAILKDGLLK